MRLNEAWFPAEIKRHLQLFWEALKKDLEFRFPETRQRLALELRMTLEKEDRQNFDALIRRFQRARRVVSVFDWGLLFEWNEKSSQAFLLSKISHIRSQYGSYVGSNLDLVHQYESRLIEIMELCRRSLLEDEASLFRLIAFRWRFSGLRDEAYYIMNRIEILCEKSEAS